MECKRAEEFIVLRQSVMEGSQSFHSQHTQFLEMCAEHNMLYSQKTHPNTLSYCTSELEKHLMLKQSLTGSLTSVKDSSLNLLNKMDKWAALVQGHIPALETKYFSKRHNSPSMERHPSLAEEELSDCQVLSPGTPPSPVMLPPSSSVSLTNNNSTSGRSHQRNSALELGPEKNGNHSTDSLLFGNRITWRKKTSAFSLHSYSATRRSPSTGFEPLSSKRGTAHSLSPPHQPPKMRQQLSVAPRSVSYTHLTLPTICSV